MQLRLGEPNEDHSASNGQKDSGFRDLQPLEQQRLRDLPQGIPVQRAPVRAERKRGILSDLLSDPVIVTNTANERKDAVITLIRAGRPPDTDPADILPDQAEREVDSA